MPIVRSDVAPILCDAGRPRIPKMSDLSLVHTGLGLAKGKAGTAGPASSLPIALLRVFLLSSNVWNLLGNSATGRAAVPPSSALRVLSRVCYFQGGSQIGDLLLDLAKPGRGLLLQARSLTSSSRERCCSSCWR